MSETSFLRRGGPVLLALLVLPALAFADPPNLQRHGRLLGGGTAPTSTTPTAAAPDAGVVATAVADAGPQADKFKETPAQYKKRQDYVDKTNVLIRSAVKANGKAVTEAERTEVLRHWRWAMRLYRIREIAEDSNDAASVTRADAALQNADTKFFGNLKTLNTKAPAAAGAAK